MGAKQTNANEEKQSWTSRIRDTSSAPERGTKYTQRNLEDMDVKLEKSDKAMHSQNWKQRNCEDVKIWKIKRT